MYHITQYTQCSQKIGRPGGSQYQQKRKWLAKKEVTAMTSSYKTKQLIKLYFVFRYVTQHDVTCVTGIYIHSVHHSFSMGYITSTIHNHA